MKSNNYYYIFALIVFLSTWIFHGQVGIPNITLAIIITVILCIFAALLFFNILKKNKFRVFLAIATISLGFYSFKVFGDSNYSYSNSVYSTFRLFLLDLDPVFTKYEKANNSYPLSIEIARYTGAAFTISTVLLFMYSYLNQSIQLFWIRNHIVISGYNKNSRVLIENLLQQNQKIILLTEDIDESQKEYLQEVGVIVFVGTQGDSKLYQKCRIDKAEIIIIFHEDDSKNLDEILNLYEFVNHDWKRLSSKQIIFHLAHGESYDLFEVIERELRNLKEVDEKEDKQEVVEKVTIKPFNLHRLIAEKALDEYPLFDGYEDKLRDKEYESLHLLFVGFGQTGRHMAIQAVERSHFMNERLLNITVLDKESEIVKSQWDISYPKSDKFVNIKFEKFDTERETIYGLKKQCLCNYTHIFICLNDDFQNLKQGMDLIRNDVPIPIYLKMSEEGRISDWLQKDTSQFSNLHLFGDIQSILNYNTVINAKEEELAEKSHKVYQENSTVKIKNWSELSTFEKESNRNQFNHAFVKLMLLGLQVVKKDDIRESHITVSEEEFKEILASEDEVFGSKLELLAFTEHERWSAFHYTRGWDTLKEISEGNRKNPEKKLHGCLVPYDELDRISEIVGEKRDFKENDKNVVNILYKAMEGTEHVIVKNK